MMKDFYSDDPPQYVLDARAERAELVRNGERMDVPEHWDNCGPYCRNGGSRALVDDMKHHDCCYLCNEAHCIVDWFVGWR